MPNSVIGVLWQTVHYLWISMCSLWCCCDFVIFSNSWQTIFGVLLTFLIWSARDFLLMNVLGQMLHLKKLFILWTDCLCCSRLCWQSSQPTHFHSWYLTPCSERHLVKFPTLTISFLPSCFFNMCCFKHFLCAEFL